MSFSEKIKLEVKHKAAFRCCMCEEFQASLQIHHIVPREQGGQDTFNNAAPLCATCHDAYGANPDKRKLIREKRDWWYIVVQEKYKGNLLFDTDTLTKISERVNRLENLQDNTDNDVNYLKVTLNEINNKLFQIEPSSEKINEIIFYNKQLIEHITPSTSANSTTTFFSHSTNIFKKE